MIILIIVSYCCFLQFLLILETAGDKDQCICMILPAMTDKTDRKVLYLLIAFSVKIKDQELLG